MVRAWARDFGRIALAVPREGAVVGVMFAPLPNAYRNEVVASLGVCRAEPSLVRGLLTGGYREVLDGQAPSSVAHGARRDGSPGPAS